MRKRLKFGENEKEIVKMVGLGIFVLTSLVVPNLPVAIKKIIKIRGNKGLQKLLKQLRNKNIIELGEDKIRLTKKGKKLLKEIQITDIKIYKTDKWDGIWRLVSYDIPEKYKKSRDLLRFILEKNNFYQIQKSLWACPYNCEEEIAILLKNLNLSEFVVFLTTDKLSNQKEMMGYFNLRD